MAKVVVEIDTSNEEMSVSIDGQEVSDVKEFFVHIDEFDNDKPRMAIIKMEPDEENKLKVVTRISTASHDEESGEAVKNGNSKAFSALSGYIQYATQNRVQKNIGNFIGQKLR
jgi:hypothetical protein